MHYRGVVQRLSYGTTKLVACLPTEVKCPTGVPISSKEFEEPQQETELSKSVTQPWGSEAMWLTLANMEVRDLAIKRILSHRVSKCQRQSTHLWICDMGVKTIKT